MHRFLGFRIYSIRLETLLRVVQTQAILSLKSMSEKVGSDIERLWIWIMSSSIGFQSIWKLNSGVVLCRIRPFPTLIEEIKWLGSGLPLTLKAWRANYGVWVIPVVPDEAVVPCYLSRKGLGYAVFIRNVSAGFYDLKSSPICKRIDFIVTHCILWCRDYWSYKLYLD